MANKYSYNSTSLQYSFMSGAANSVTRVAGFTFSIETMITCAMISCASSEINANIGAGVLFLKQDMPTDTTIAFPTQDLILSCSLVATIKGVVGESKIQFSTKDTGFIVTQDQTVGLYHLSLDAGRTISGIATILSLPTIGVC